MTTDTTQISEDVGYALIETHLGLKKRHDHTVIDSKTGRYTDSARYFGLMDAAYQAGHAAAAETAAAVAKEREPQMPEGWAFYSADFSSNAADAFKPGSVLLTRTGRNRAAWLAMSEEDQEVNALYASGRGFTLDEAVRAAIHCVDAIRAKEPNDG